MRLRCSSSSRRPFLRDVWTARRRRAADRGHRHRRMTVCPSCGELSARGQEYCLECGIRLPTSGVGNPRSAGSKWVLRTAIAAVVAFVGVAAAVAATGGSTSGPEVIVATGGFATVPTSSTLPSPAGEGAVADWPPGEDGWTVAVASLPQTGGRRAAIARARTARMRGLTQVGVLDSSRYASLHPGYWIVFTGVYSSEAEATSALETARGFARTATVRRVVS